MVAIEEPESHLHPKAIRDLRDIIFDLSKENQIVVSSHSPLLVRWQGPTSTVIVRNNRASAAGKISEVRDALRVVVSDNLTSVEFSLIVEGETDKIILEKIIKEEGSASLASAFDSERFAIRATNSASKLSYLLASAEQNMLGLHVFFDNDEPARNEVQRAIHDKRIKHSQYTLCTCQGMANSEIEDIISQKIYKDIIYYEYGVDIDTQQFRSNSHKWPDRMKNTFNKSGKIWNEDIKKKVKISVARAFNEAKHQDSLITQKRHSLDTLLKSLEKYAQQ